MEPGDIIEATEPGLGICSVDCYEGALEDYTWALLWMIGHQMGFAVTDYEFGPFIGYYDYRTQKPVKAQRVRFSLVKVETPESMKPGDIAEITEAEHAVTVRLLEKIMARYAKQAPESMKPGDAH